MSDDKKTVLYVEDLQRAISASTGGMLDDINWTKGGRVLWNALAQLREPKGPKETPHD